MNEQISKIQEGQVFCTSLAVHFGQVLGDYSVNLYLIRMAIGLTQIAYHLDCDGRTDQFDQFPDVCKPHRGAAEWDRTIYLTEAAGWMRAREVLTIAYPACSLEALDKHLNRGATREQVLRSLDRVLSKTEASRPVAVETGGGVDAVCVFASGDATADEMAYWKAVQVFAQRGEFWIVGESAALRALDSSWGKVTKWLPAVADIPRNSYVLEVHAAQYVVFN